MTSTPKLAIAIGYIDDDLVTGAVEYMPKKKMRHQKKWFRFGAIAACLVFLLILPISRLVVHQQPTTQQPTINSAGDGTDADCLELTFEEALTNKTFGEYFPQAIADGYYLETEVYVYGEEYLEAAFVNDETGDLLLLRIALRSRFDNVQTNTVFYRSENSDNKASFIYVDCGDYIALYSSKKCDLQTLPGFEKMVVSAEYFD
jgi:hypothetical protein